MDSIHSKLKETLFINIINIINICLVFIILFSYFDSKADIEKYSNERATACSVLKSALDDDKNIYDIKELARLQKECASILKTHAKWKQEIFDKYTSAPTIEEVITKYVKENITPFKSMIAKASIDLEELKLISNLKISSDTLELITNKITQYKELIKEHRNQANSISQISCKKFSEIDEKIKNMLDINVKFVQEELADLVNIYNTQIMKIEHNVNSKCIIIINNYKKIVDKMSDILTKKEIKLEEFNKLSMKAVLPPEFKKKKEMVDDFVYKFKLWKNSWTGLKNIDRQTNDDARAGLRIISLNSLDRVQRKLTIVKSRVPKWIHPFIDAELDEDMNKVKNLRNKVVSVEGARKQLPIALKELSKYAEDIVDKCIEKKAKYAEEWPQIQENYRNAIASYDIELNKEKLIHIRHWSNELTYLKLSGFVHVCDSLVNGTKTGDNKK